MIPVRWRGEFWRHFLRFAITCPHFTTGYLWILDAEISVTAGQSVSEFFMSTQTCYE